MRLRPAALLAAVTMTAVAALAIGACVGGDGPTVPTMADRRDAARSARATTTTAGIVLSGIPLVVAEQGVSSFPDPFDRSATLGGYGVILKNPNPDRLASGVRVITHILDSTGTELLVDRTIINGVMPGQRMAVGRTLIEPIVDPTQLRIEVEVSGWLEATPSDGGLIAQDVVTEPEADGGAITRFNVSSTWPEPEEGVDVTAVYRAADGRILSAETTTLPLVPPTGVTPGQIRLLSPIPDLVSTEVFVGRGLAAQTSG